MTFSIFFISSALLSFEITLMRILQIEGFGNFTFSAITIALIGFGASGTLAYIFRDTVFKKSGFTFVLSSALFILFLGAGFYLSWLINFDPLRIVWEVRQTLKLLLIFFFYSLPFIAGALQIVLGFGLIEAGKTYFSNLTGSFTGIILSIASMYFIEPKGLLLLPLVLGSVSTIISLSTYITAKESNKTSLIFLSIISIGIGFFLYDRGDIRIMEYRPLKLVMNLPDVKKIYRKHSPFGTIDVIKSRYIRVVHGLSLRFDGALPEQLGIYIDGDLLAPFDLIKIPDSKTIPVGNSQITGNNHDINPSDSSLIEEESQNQYPDYLLYLPQEAPYLLKSKPEVFLAGLGGRSNIERAILNNSSMITVTEENPILIKTIKWIEDTYNLGSINRYCRIINTTPRIYLTGNTTKWDIIELSIPETALHSISGIYSRSSAYNITVEAIELYLKRLKDHGILSITIQLKNPPRKLPRLVNNVTTAMRNMGLNPEESIFIIRSWSTATILAKNKPFKAREIEKLKNFCKMKSFDIVYYGGINKEEINKYNIVKNAIYYKTISLLLENQANFEKRYIFNVRSTTDNNPFFTFFIKLSKLGELFKQTGGQWLFIIEGGYLVIFITFVLVCILSFILVIFPLYLKKMKKNIQEKRVPKKALKVFSYYSAIGLGYMLIELTIIEKFNLLIVNPIFSSSFTIATLLLFSGLGAYLSGKIFKYNASLIKYRNNVRMILLIISAYFLILLLALYLGYEKIMVLKPVLKYMVCFSAIMPPAFLMGMPFPSSIEVLKQVSSEMIPWGWSVNGYFSVMASAGAIIVMVSFGITTTGILAALLYIAAIPFFPYFHERSSLLLAE